jgi:hypothetical protein
MTHIDPQIHRAILALRDAMADCRANGISDGALCQAALTEAMPLLISAYGSERASAMLKGLSALAASEGSSH